MKKLTLVAAMAMAVATMVSCGSNTPKASLKSDVDSVSYALGLTRSQGLKDFLVGQMGIDTAYMAEFIKGLNEGTNVGDNKKKAAYYAGLQIGQQVSNQLVPSVNYELFGNDSTATISMKNFMAGFVSGVTAKQGLMDQQQAQSVITELGGVIKTRQLEKQYGHNKAEGEQFLTENAKKDGVKTLESGVQYRVIKEGSGKIPADTSMVKVHYEGRLLNDTVFDSSYKRGNPMEIRANQVIRGWTDALVHMPAGSTWEVYIPQELAYGERQAGRIEPFSTLIFKIELLEVK